MRKISKLLLLTILTASLCQAAIVINYNNKTGDGLIAGGDTGVGNSFFPPASRSYTWVWSSNAVATNFATFVNLGLNGAPAFLNGSPTTISGSSNTGAFGSMLLADDIAGPLTFTTPTFFTLDPGLWNHGLGTFIGTPAGATDEILVFQVVPEPSTYLAIATTLGLVSFLGYRRFRSKAKTSEHAV